MALSLLLISSAKAFASYFTVDYERFGRPMRAMRPMRPMRMEAGRRPLAHLREMKGKAEDVMADFVKYYGMEKSHKHDWLSYARDYAVAKFDLLAKHHDEKFDLKIDKLHKLAHAAVGEKAGVLVHSLDRMLAADDRHLEEWHAMCKNFHERAKKLYMQHKDDIKNFKKSLRAQQEEEAEEGEEGEEGEEMEAEEEVAEIEEKAPTPKATPAPMAPMKTETKTAAAVESKMLAEK